MNFRLILTLVGLFVAWLSEEARTGLVAQVEKLIQEKWRSMAAGVLVRVLS